MSEAPVQKRRNWRPRRRPATIVNPENSTSSGPVTQEAVVAVSPVLGTRQVVHVRSADMSGDLVDKLIRDLRKSYECMVCMSAIRFNSPIWTCGTCWAMFHLGCTHQWIKRNSATTGARRAAWEWRCPGCQYVYVESRLPVYTCFCGSVQTPPSSRQITPHSCGESCRRPRPNCSHPCTLSCHPGPCPPCQSLLPASPCFAYPSHPSSTAYVRCGAAAALPHSCGKVCGRRLACGLHDCGEFCHDGACLPCTTVVGTVSCLCIEPSEFPLVCGSEKKQIHCQKKCGKKFNCNIHSCTSQCHIGPCGPCPLDPIIIGTRCFCGKKNFEKNPREKCSDPILSCHNTCDKIHSDCLHPCSAICHPGQCPPCKVRVPHTCRCGKTRQFCPCSSPPNSVTCTQICRALKSCSKHRCTNTCCNDDMNHLCLQVCNKKLSCSQHVCDDICHLGKCPPCRVVSREALTCGCGKESLAPPITCGTAPPACFAPCMRPHPECGHPCPSRCHQGSCGLCLVLGPKVCDGGHETLSGIPCHVTSISCGRKCMKQLSCNVHFCLSPCHEGICSGCTQSCLATRTDCGHSCGALCSHAGPCPAGPCEARVRVACPCGLHTEEFACHTQGAQVGCSTECAAAARAAKLRFAFRSDVEPGPDSEIYADELVVAAERFPKYIAVIDGLLFDGVEQRSKTIHLSPTCGARRWLALEYAQIHYRFDATVSAPDFHITLSYVPGQTRVPVPSLTALLDMAPSKALPFTVDFYQDGSGPQIHLYDVGKGFGRTTTETVHRLLNPIMRNAFRTRRGERFDLFVDFLDPNKAVMAFRRMSETHGLDSCRLLNVTLFSKNDSLDSPAVSAAECAED